ncbi:hypothetical protein HYU19_04415 [Candidatus Woesearchaeota archaeon]|nr:hypothetical protein [Candidatus Woesearchaeota archaeon]
MAAEIKRRLYKRGSSYETTIPMPLLFAIDLSRPHDVLFKFDSQQNRWYLEIQERQEQETANPSKKKNVKEKRAS